ncbi:hypothetical protein [Psychrobacter pygoscelis]|uniref:hypothetical protein n=1 Tax=Psychrobacter pygoscelis TaxID=2488563 RepID=UPI00103B1C66|nr:hypothetical protein [Psychrobacter pygoscelis]
MIINSTKTLLSGLVVATALSAAQLSMAATDPISVNLTAHQVVKDSKGAEQLKAVTQLNGAEVIRYTATYTNHLDKAVNNIAVTLPIPANMSFTGSAYPSSALASTDGVTFKPMPLTQVINGKTVKVPFSQYKSLRWTIKLLPAGKSAAVSADTKLDLSKS